MLDPHQLIEALRPSGSFVVMGEPSYEERDPQAAVDSLLAAATAAGNSGRLYKRRRHYISKRSLNSWQDEGEVDKRSAGNHGKELIGGLLPIRVSFAERVLISISWTLLLQEDRGGRRLYISKRPDISKRGRRGV